MQNMHTRDRIFYGWWIVVGVCGLMFLAAGTGLYSFGVLFKPLIQDFGWSRGATTIAQSIYFLMNGAFGVLCGKLIEHYNPVKIILIGISVQGVARILLSLTDNLWYFYLLYFFIGAGAGASGLVPLASIVSNWFVRRRGTAIGITMAGIALGATVIVPILNFIIQISGWRAGFLFLGLLYSVVGIPIATFVLKARPQEMSLLPDGKKPSQMEPSPEETIDTANIASKHIAETSGKQINTVLTSSPVWLLSLGFFFAMTGEMGVLVHEVNFITDMGIPATAAAVAFGFTGGIGGIGKIVLGWLTDRVSARYVVLLCFTIQVVGISILLQTHSITMLWLFVVVFGFGMGGAAALIPVAVGDRFGLTSFGVTFGVVNFLQMVGSTVGPLFAGYIFDITGSYNFAFSTFIVTYIISLITIYITWGIDPKPFKSVRT